METKFKALLALLITVFLWSASVVISRSIVDDVRPLALNFYRLLIASIFFAPFFLSSKPWRSKTFPKLILASFFSAVNFIFFVLGIQYTSGSASQLIYSVIPVLIVIAGYFFFKEKISKEKITGVFIGLLGIILIVYLSAVESGTTIAGNLFGNLLIMIAMTGWLLYVLLTKKLLKIFTPIDIASTAIITAFSISVPLFLKENIFTYSPSFSINIIAGILFIGFFGAFLPNILYQYGLKQVSPLTASFTTYIQPITTTILEIIFLGETLTVGFIFGGILVFSGVFLATTLEIYKRRR